GNLRKALLRGPVAVARARRRAGRLQFFVGRQQQAADSGMQLPRGPVGEAHAFGGILLSLGAQWLGRPAASNPPCCPPATVGLQGCFISLSREARPACSCWACSTPAF